MLFFLSLQSPVFDPRPVHVGFLVAYVTDVRVLLLLRSTTVTIAGPSSRAVYGVGLRPLAYWDRGFEFQRGHGCLSVVSVMCCQVEVSATSWSLVQRSPTDCDALLCVIKKPQKWGGHGPRWAAAPQKTNKTNFVHSGCWNICLLHSVTRVKHRIDTQNCVFTVLS